MTAHACEQSICCVLYVGVIAQACEQRGWACFFLPIALCAAEELSAHNVINDPLHVRGMMATRYRVPEPYRSVHSALRANDGRHSYCTIDAVHTLHGCSNSRHCRVRECTSASLHRGRRLTTEACADDKG